MKRSLTLAGKIALALLVPQWVLAQWAEGQEGQLLIRGGWLFDSVSEVNVIDLTESDTILPGMIDLHAHYNLDLVDHGRVEEVIYNGIVFLANGVTST